MGIIHTKLNRPLVADNFIPRPQLDELMGQCPHKPLTLVTAPAGYGKSSLVSYRMQNCDLPNAWFSLDENDNDLALFLNYLVGAIQSMFSDAVRQKSALVDAPSLLPITPLATSLINELNRIEQSFFLVLDDYHLVREPSVHDQLVELLHYPPPSMHLIIISRCAPPLPLSAYRAREQLIEIGPRELRFTARETAAYLSQVLQSEVDPSVAADLHKKTEGWVTGLQLATLALRYHVKASGLPLDSLKNTQHAREYLYNEVFVRQPPEIQHYLLCTAILDRFNAPLCQAVAIPDGKTGQGDLNGWEFIAWLKRENLFLIPVDAEGGWYRYHHLFRALLVNLLSRRYGPTRTTLVHNQAIEWFADHGLNEEALLHALAIDDTKRAVELVVTGGFKLMDRQDWPRLERWLSMLPRDEVEHNPELLILKAWLLHMQFNLPDMSLCLRQIKAMKSSPQPDIQTGFENVRGHYLALLAHESYLAADGAMALRYAQLACGQIPSHHMRPRALAEIFRARAYQMTGDLQTGLDRYLENMKELSSLDENCQPLLMANLCSLFWLEADLHSLRQTAECALMAGRDKLLPEAAAVGHYFLGIASYCRNDLDRAEEELSIVVDDLYGYGTVNFAFSAFVLALVHQARGKPAMARKTCEGLVTSGRQSNNTALMQLAQWFSAELALRQGRLAEALQWAKQFRHEQPLPTNQFYLPQLTLAKILLAQDTVKSRQQSGSLLNETLSLLSSIHNKVFQIDVLALQALLQKAQGNQAAAQEKLNLALDLAEPGGWMRPFLDLGAPMKELLVQLHKKGCHQQYAAQILAAFGTNGYPLFGRSSNNQAPSPLLTNREIDILHLAGKRLRDKEIAEELSISPDTVKAHMRNVRKKMNANSRMDAVVKAIDLNILPPI